MPGGGATRSGSSNPSLSWRCGRSRPTTPRASRLTGTEGSTNTGRGASGSTSASPRSTRSSGGGASTDRSEIGERDSEPLAVRQDCEVIVDPADVVWTDPQDLKALPRQEVGTVLERQGAALLFVD